MSIRKTPVAALLAAAGMAVSAASMAQSRPADAGWYVGVSVGQSQQADTCEGIPGCDDKDTAFKVFGGYQVNRNFAIEGGYTDLGKTNINVSGPGGNLSANIKANAWEVVGVGILPVADRFALLGKIGLYRGEVEGTGSGVVLGIPISLSGKDTNTDLTFGVGAKFDITRNFAVRGEWQRYSSMGGSEVVETDVDVLSVGVTFKF
jgi:OOP family OmpA-OmpF porin